jgi:hypothetical protein
VGFGVWGSEVGRDGVSGGVNEYECEGLGWTVCVWAGEKPCVCGKEM